MKEKVNAQNSLFPWKSAQNLFSSILVIKKFWKWGIVGNLILNNFIIVTFDQNMFLLVRKSKNFWENVRKWAKMYTFIVDTYFSILFFFQFFFRFQLTLRTFWVPYRATFSIFCPIWQGNSFFCVKYSPFLLKLRKSLPKVCFVGENPGHFTKNSSISWRVGTHFEHNVQN